MSFQKAPVFAIILMLVIKITYCQLCCDCMNTGPAFGSFSCKISTPVNACQNKICIIGDSRFTNNPDPYCCTTWWDAICASEASTICNADTPSPVPSGQVPSPRHPPTYSPTTREPTTRSPTINPTKPPTDDPTRSPTTGQPTTQSPTTNPTPSPTDITDDPTRSPTTRQPTTQSPTINPTKAPTSVPSSFTASPTQNSQSPTSNTPAPTSNTGSPTSNTASPTSITPAPTTQTAAPTSNTASPTIRTSAPSPSSECSHAPKSGVCGNIPSLLQPISSPYSSCSYGQCIYVSSSSSCSSGCGSSNNPWKTIQDGIDNNNYGEKTIIVSPGIYTGSGNYDIFAQYETIKIYSSSGPDNTIIDCAGNGYGFYLKHGTVEIKGVTIQNCVASQQTLPYTVGDTPISARFGGAFYIHQLTATFTDVIIRENDAEYGGAIFSYQATLVFRNSNIYRNCASERGGGIYFFQGSTSIENTILSCNVANDAGGIYNYQTSTNIILQSQISNNDATSIANEYYCDAASVSIDSGNGMAMIFDNDIASWNNNEITYCHQCSIWGNGQNFCVSTGGYSTTPIVSIWTITVIISCCLLILGLIYLTYKHYFKLNNNNKYDYDPVKFMDSEQFDESEINQININ